MADALSVDDYSRQGFVVMRRLFDETQVDDLRSHVAWLEERNDPRKLGLRESHGPRDRHFLEIASAPRLLDVVEQVLDGALLLWNAYYFLKPAHEGAEIPWHEDGVALPFEPPKAVRIWIALDDATPATGGLRVLPGSHRLDLTQSIAPREGDRNVYRYAFRAYSELISSGAVSESDIVDLSVVPGDAVVFGPSLLHSSYPNHSPQRRCSLALTYVSSDVRVIEDHEVTLQGAVKLYLLRGSAEAAAHLPCEPWPDRDPAGYQPA